MKKILVIGLVIVTVSLLGGFAIPVLAHGLDDGDTTLPSSEAWEAMHEACEEGDWEAMVEAAEEVHEDLGYDYPVPEDGNRNSWGGAMGGHMGGWGGMMGW